MLMVLKFLSSLGERFAFQRSFAQDFFGSFSYPNILRERGEEVCSGGAVGGFGFHLEGPEWMGLFQILWQGPNKTWKVLCMLALGTENLSFNPRSEGQVSATSRVLRACQAPVWHFYVSVHLIFWLSYQESDCHANVQMTGLRCGRGDPRLHRLS